MTRPEFGLVSAMLCAGLDREMSPEQSEVWFALLERFPAWAVKAAVVRHLSESTDPFLPTPGVISRLTVEAITGKTESAESAYRRLCKIRISWGSMVHRGELVARKHIDEQLWGVIEGLGGWERFCGERDGSQSTEFAQFRNAWERAATEAVLALAVPEAAQPGVTGASAKRIQEERK